MYLWLMNALAWMVVIGAAVVVFIFVSAGLGALATKVFRRRSRPKAKGK
jgi:hypothetical protein